MEQQPQVVQRGESGLLLLQQGGVFALCSGAVHRGDVEVQCHKNTPCASREAAAGHSLQGLAHKSRLKHQGVPQLCPHW